MEKLNYPHLSPISNEQRNDRRTFVKNIAGALAALPFASFGAGNPPAECHLFLSESLSTGAFTLGVLKIKSLTAAKTAIKNLRIQHHYRTEFEYRSTDRFKSDYAKSLINYFVSDSAVSFSGRSGTFNFDPNHPAASENELLAYIANYKRAISDAISANETAHVFLSVKNDALLNTLKQELAQVKTIKWDTMMHGDLYQLSQFLSGSVSAETITLTNKVKANLKTYLRAKLNVSNVSKCQTNKFYIRTV